jgi:hypothetical protein
MIINFRTRRISWDTHELTRIPTIIINKKTHSIVVVKRHGIKMIRHYSLNNVHDTHMYHAPIISIAWSQRAWLCSSTFLYLLEIKYCSHLLVFIWCLVYFYINSMDIKYNKPSDYSLCSYFFFSPSNEHHVHVMLKN